MIKLFTIGFTKKSAKQFFELLKRNGVEKLVDIRINKARIDSAMPIPNLSARNPKTGAMIAAKRLLACELADSAVAKISLLYNLLI